jgi:ribosomal protein S8
MTNSGTFLSNLRWCLLSGGSYRHQNISRVKVAKTICDVLEAAGFIGDVKVVLPVAEDPFKMARLSEYKRQEELLTEGTDINKTSALLTQCQSDNFDDHINKILKP